MQDNGQEIPHCALIITTDIEQNSIEGQGFELDFDPGISSYLGLWKQHV